MQIELKRFTTNARLSQETTAFAADIWVNGKKVGHAANDGHGGCTLVHLDPATRSAVDVHGLPLVPAELKRFTSGAEWIIDQLVEAELQKRDDRAHAKRIANADVKESAHYTTIGLRAARFRHGDTWHWFGLKTDADPKAVAIAIAAKHKVTVDELVVLS